MKFSGNYFVEKALDTIEHRHRSTTESVQAENVRLRTDNSLLREAIRAIRGKCNNGSTPMDIIAACDAALARLEPTR